MRSSRLRLGQRTSAASDRFAVALPCLPSCSSPLGASGHQPELLREHLLRAWFPIRAWLEPPGFEPHTFILPTALLHPPVNAPPCSSSLSIPSNDAETVPATLPLHLQMEDFSRAIARCAAGQIADAVGFEAVQESAIDMLSELMLRYISEVGAASHSYAELAGRTDTNAFDVVCSLPPWARLSPISPLLPPLLFPLIAACADGLVSLLILARQLSPFSNPPNHRRIAPNTYRGLDAMTSVQAIVLEELGMNMDNLRDYVENEVMVPHPPSPSAAPWPCQPAPAAKLFPLALHHGGCSSREVATQAENPFNHPLPKYPIQTQPRHAPTFKEMGEVTVLQAGKEGRVRG